MNTKFVGAFVVGFAAVHAMLWFSENNAQENGSNQKKAVSGGATSHSETIEAPKPKALLNVEGLVAEFSRSGHFIRADFLRMRELAATPDDLKSALLQLGKNAIDRGDWKTALEITTGCPTCGIYLDQFYPHAETLKLAIAADPKSLILWARERMIEGEKRFAGVFSDGMAGWMAVNPKEAVQYLVDHPPTNDLERNNLYVAIVSMVGRVNSPSFSMQELSLFGSYDRNPSATFREICSSIGANDPKKGIEFANSFPYAEQRSKLTDAVLSSAAGARHPDFENIVGKLSDSPESRNCIKLWAANKFYLDGKDEAVKGVGQITDASLQQVAVQSILKAAKSKLEKAEYDQFENDLKNQ